MQLVVKNARIRLSLKNPRDVLHCSKRAANKGRRSAWFSEIELSWQRLRRSTFSSWQVICRKSKVANFNQPHLHVAPPLKVTPFEFCRDLPRQKTRVTELSCDSTL